MSFSDFAKNTNKGRGTSRPRDEDQEGDLPEGNVFQLTTRVAAYKRMVDLIGTKKDTKQHRARLKEAGDDIGTLAKRTSAALKQSKPGAEDKQRHSKLLRDFQNVLGEFQKFQRRCAEKEVASLPADSPLKKSKRKAAKAAAAAHAYGSTDASTNPYANAGGSGVWGAAAEEDDRMPLVSASQQEQIRVDGELEYNNLLIEEREQDIHEIQHQIGEVNEIFQDLAVLVTEQGDMVDDIEANIVTTYDKTITANKELKKAAKHQKGSRAKLCILTLVVAIGIILILIAVGVI